MTQGAEAPLVQDWVSGQVTYTIDSDWPADNRHEQPDRELHGEPVSATASATATDSVSDLSKVLVINSRDL